MTAKLGWLSITTIAFATLGMGRLAPEARGAATPVCTITFQDALPTTSSGLPYGIASDGGGSYVDGAQNVSCQVGGPKSNDIKLSLGAKRGTRSIVEYFNEPSQSPLSGPNDGSYVTIQQVANLAPGTSTATNAHYLVNSYSLNWCGGIGEGNCVSGSNAVWVTRSDANNWVVTTYASVPGVGDLADLTPTSGGTHTLYHMPFQLYIYCPTCTWP